MRCEIDFTGLCAFVRREDDEIKVYMLEEGGGHAHAARLSVDVEQVDTTYASYPPTIVATPDGKQLAYWDLKKLHMSARTTGGSGDLRVDEGKRMKKMVGGKPYWKNQVPQGSMTIEDPEEDISWVGEPRKMESKSFAKTPPAAATFTIREGTLRSCVEREWKHVVWRFSASSDCSAPHPDYLQVLASRVRLTFGSVDSLTLEHQGSSGPEPVVTLGGPGVVRAMVANLPEGAFQASPYRIHHFVAYYDLLKKPPAQRRVPCRSGGPSNITPAAIRPAYCPPAWLDFR